MWITLISHRTALFQQVCELDLEGIIAKQKFGPYVPEREQMRVGVCGIERGRLNEPL
jgi:hypothetical protein